jgi:mRNA interferase MazF
MKEGGVALTPLPQADGAIKNRPAIALRQMPPFGDWLVCSVSTQLRKQAEQSSRWANAKPKKHPRSKLEFTPTFFSPTSQR